MAVGLTRATVQAIKEETTAGTYVPPAAGSDFVPIRPGDEITFEPEQLESDELLNDIGATKSFVGKELTTGTHPAYLRHSGVEGQEPELGVLYESVMGTKTVNATEYNTAASSTTAVVKVADGTNFYVGQALLIKDSTNGYSIRNVASISTNDLNLNFALDAAPAVSQGLGKAITYIPAGTGHPTFSKTKYLGSGHALEVSAGNTVTELSLTADANGFAEVEFSFEGTRYYYNPITITSSTRFIDFTDDSGTYAAAVEAKIYETPAELASALQDAMNAASAETYTVTYSNVTGKFTITYASAAVLSLLWNTGTNAANSIGTKIGFLVAANDTGAITYTSDNAQAYAVPYTPSYDVADAIIIKDSELFVGSSTDNICVCAQSISLSIGKEVEDVDCICSESGVQEKIPTGRTVEMSVTSVLDKYDVKLLNALLNNNGVSAMLNIGPKSGGNFIAGKCFNVYLQNCTVSTFKTTGENFIQAEFTLKGFVTSSSKDLYLNFV